MKRLILILLLASAAPAAIFLNSFNSGQLSKRLKVRQDLDKTSMGSETLENILIRPQGLAYKRPGTEYIDSGGGTWGQDSTTTGEYPTLRELTAEEIPDAPSEPSVTSADTAVSNATELQAMAGAGKYYLTGNIDLTGVDWTPITNFSGVLDGKGYTVSNLALTVGAGVDEQGIFGNLQTGAEIYDINFTDCTVTGSSTSDNIAILAGYGDYQNGEMTFKDITFTNCTATGLGHIGMLAGYLESNYSTIIYNCHAINCEVSGGGYSGGLVGWWRVNTFDDTEYCYMVNCSVQGGTIGDGAGTPRGGLIGQVYTQYGRTTPLPDPTADHNSGGGVYNCYSTAAVSITPPTNANSIGGLIGSLYGGFDVVSSYASGNVTANVDTSRSVSNMGGLIGSISSFCNIIDSYSTGDITTNAAAGAYTTGYIGGLIGYIGFAQGVNLTRSYSTSAITVNDGLAYWYGIGGFIGYLANTKLFTTYSEDSAINRCWASGDITIEDASAYYDNYAGAGGFIGLLQSEDAGNTVQITFENCYTWSSIIFTDAEENATVGGFLGVHRAHYSYDYETDYVFTNCYVAQTDTAAGSDYTGQLPAGNYTHGFIGEEVDAITAITSTASYWDTETSSVSDSETHATGQTTNWLQTQSNYEAAGWDFDTVWVLSETTENGDWTFTPVAASSTAVRLIPFEYSTEDAYVLEFGHEYIGFLRTVP